LDAPAGPHEQWQDEVMGRERGLADEIAQHRMLAQAARPDCGVCPQWGRLHECALRSSRGLVVRLGGTDTGPRRRLVPLRRQTFLECREEQQHVVFAAAITHQADAPHLALEIAQPAADLDAELVEELLAYRAVIDTGRDLDGVELWQLMPLGGGVRQSQ